MKEGGEEGRRVPLRGKVAAAAVARPKREGVQKYPGPSRKEGRKEGREEGR